jgi:proteasome lid subunit RPN8/RPN11
MRKTRLRKKSRLIRHRRPPPLRLTPFAWAKLLHLRDLGGTEVGGFGVSRPDDLLLVEDVQLVRQQCTPVTVKFDDESVADYFDNQVDQGRSPEQFARIWIHTHPGDSPYPSCTDEETFERCFGAADWALMFIVARGGQTYARLRFNAGPCGHLVLPVEIDFAESFPAADPATWDTEYRQMVTIEPDRPRQPQVAKLADDRRVWPEDYRLRFNEAWLESFSRDVGSNLPLEYIDG